MNEAFKIDNEYIYMWDESNESYIPICKKILITKKLNIIDTDETYLTIRFENDFGSMIEKTIAKSQITRKELLKMMNWGIDINERNVVYVRDYLYWAFNQPNVSKELGHKKLGWIYEDNKRTNTFKYRNIICEDGINSVDSSYKGDLAITSHGTSEEYISFIKKELKDSPYLQLALVIGLASPILCIIGEKLDMENILVNYTGNSSTGKSTALALSMSPWGNPSITSSKDSLVKTWNSTENAMFKNIAGQGLQGVPIAFDEIGSGNIRDFTKFTYKFAAGSDKGRMDSENNLRQKEVFRCILISSGEVEIKQQMTDMTLGTKIIRLTEFNNIPWTKNAKQSNRIKEFVINHNGTLGEEFIKHILEYDIDDIFKVWKNYSDELTPLMKPYIKQFSDRMASKYAIFLLTFEMISDMLEVDWDKQSFIDLLILSIKDKENDVNIAENAYNAIMEFFSEKINHFIQFTGCNNKTRIPNNNQHKDIWGKYNEIEIVIMKKYFLETMRKNGFVNPNLVLSHLLEKGYIIPEKDRNRNNKYSRRELNGKQKIFVLVLKRDIEINNDNQLELEEDSDEG